MINRNNTPCLCENPRFSLVNLDNVRLDDGAIKLLVSWCKCVALEALAIGAVTGVTKRARYFADRAVVIVL